MIHPLPEMASHRVAEATYQGVTPLAEPREIMPDFLEEACAILHDSYELAAVTNGWVTNRDSAVPWSDVPESNRDTMRTAVRELIVWLDRQHR